MVLQGGMIQEKLTKSPVSAIRDIGHAVVQNGWFIEATLKSIGKTVFEENTVVVATRPFFVNHYDKEVYVAPDYFYSAQYGLVIHKSSAAKSCWDRKLRRIVATGLYEKVQT
ncbi:hypothetical protein CEXT_760481 [Caerostris extrusa]|uniref:Uncharacterized protein n=1 Tax=Caerostris extrusa TaxID=172846 RepID=A0AAV4Q5Q6_CAEEX|nr:hypothetical protein CEXT_760481 [Caerostris extrusa]